MREGGPGRGREAAAGQEVRPREAAGVCRRRGRLCAPSGCSLLSHSVRRAAQAGAGERAGVMAQGSLLAARNYALLVAGAHLAAVGLAGLTPVLPQPLGAAVAAMAAAAGGPGGPPAPLLPLYMLLAGLYAAAGALRFRPQEGGAPAAQRAL